MQNLATLRFQAARGEHKCTGEAYASATLWAVGAECQLLPSGAVRPLIMKGAVATGAEVHKFVTASLLGAATTPLEKKQQVASDTKLT
mmetsp:Transcript_130962/g.261246  ORF Transcript_130962/g.261246 Transcript_130962/m.261246 type:complete len:88 (-) Transcript_130962:44-307(-)